MKVDRISEKKCVKTTKEMKGRKSSALNGDTIDIFKNKGEIILKMALEIR